MDIRIEIMRALASGEKCVSSLADELDLSVGTVSHHLRILLKAGLLELNQHGTVHNYRLSESAQVRDGRNRITVRVRTTTGEAVSLQIFESKMGRQAVSIR
jgi:DNA-binding transcriptional ArsR family regulator